jgi:hypothetical protein
MKIRAQGMGRRVATVLRCQRGRAGWSCPKVCSTNGSYGALCRRALRRRHCTIPERAIRQGARSAGESTGFGGAHTTCFAFNVCQAGNRCCPQRLGSLAIIMMMHPLLLDLSAHFQVCLSLEICCTASSHKPTGRPDDGGRQREFCNWSSSFSDVPVPIWVPQRSAALPRFIVTEVGPKVRAVKTVFVRAGQGLWVQCAVGCTHPCKGTADSPDIADACRSTTARVTGATHRAAHL